MIDHIFTLINSGIIFFLIVYLFRKYGLPLLERENAQEVLQLQNLKQSLNDAQKRIHELEIIRKNQDVELSALQANILEWRKRVEDAAINHENELLSYKASIKAKQQKQAQNYKNEQLIEEVKPLVLQQLVNQAQDYMQDASHQEQYMEKALETFERIKV